MLPDIGIMIGVYIVFRCCEVFARSESQFASRGAQVAVRLLAVLSIVITLFFVVDLFLSGSHPTTGLP